MVRYGLVTVLALLTAGVGVAQAGGKKEKEKELRFQGMLTKDDPRDRRRNAASKVYTVKLKAGRSYQIDMKSRAFDSYLFLEDAKGRQLAEDDDSGGMLDAQIIFNCQRDGDYKITCTAFSEQGVGPYTLTVKVRGQEQPTSNPHTVLLGKPAPDIQADFAVNGKAGKLSDLKGKVVLVEFWNVRSAPCVAVLPRLRDLYKAHKEAGLEVVGVTFYNYELGHNLTFDKAAGTVKNAPKASKETEQALLKDFAAHHKIEYLLMALPLQDALKVFDTYAVNGIPQFVLIDRQGVARLIRVGEAESITSALDTEIKKLLEQK
jgi:thiol-disulfide isomerase/thioredoxin